MEAIKIVNLEVIEKHSAELVRLNQSANLLSRHDENMQMLFSLEAEIFADINNIKNSFIKIGEKLWKIERGNLIGGYISVGYHACYNIYDYAYHVFGLRKTSVKNLMSVYETFGDMGHGVRPEYVGYSYTQLVEMLPLADVERKYVSPDMTIDKIRKFKQGKSSFDSGQLTDRTIKGQIEIPFSDIETYPSEETTKAEAAVISSGELKPCSKLTFKNDTQRLDWLKEYTKNCYLYVDIPPLEMKVYRYDFINGVSLYVTELYGGSSGANYQLLSEDKKNGYPVCRHFSFHTQTINQICDWIKTNRTEI